MKLHEIFGYLDKCFITGGTDPEITAITADSRKAAPGALFAALSGTKDDGIGFIPDALARGASAVLTDMKYTEDLPVSCVLAQEPRKALGEAANILYGRPADFLKLIGVTGTNGKTTTAYLVRHIFNTAGKRCGMLGTIEYDTGRTVAPAPLTTPDTVRFTASLAEMRDAGCMAAVAECSSHALDQDRIWPHRFAAAIFTNLTRDHLDYHVDMESYLQAKQRLFSMLSSNSYAIINFSDQAGERMVEKCPAQIWGYVHDGTQSKSHHTGARIWRLSIVETSIKGQMFRLESDGLCEEFSTHLVGRHNAENCAGAVLAAMALGVSATEIRSALGSFPGVPGRLERMEAPWGATAFVDYSHTDGALRTALSVLRPLTQGRIITVFGCGGDRDKGKRPLMARAAEEQSDIVYVTSDNPRTEDPLAIIADILPGFHEPDKVRKEPDRGNAIRAAVAESRQGDVLLIAGKGHEDYQIIGTVKHHLDDRELVRDAFATERA